MGWAQARSIHAFISRTAWVRPTKTDRLIMLWPMLSSSMRSSRAIGRDVLVIEAVPGVQFQAGGEGSDCRGLEGIELAAASGSLAARWRNGLCAARLRWRLT